MSLDHRDEVPEQADSQPEVTGAAGDAGVVSEEPDLAAAAEETKAAAEAAGNAAKEAENAAEAAENAAEDAAASADESAGRKDKNKAKEEEPLDLKKEVISWIKTFAITIGIVLFVLVFIILNAQIPTESMESTIMAGDRLIGLRFSYWFSEPERGDIILFKFPLDESRLFIKRVIGLPGETVTIEDGHVYIDGSEVPLDETYLNEEWTFKSDDLVYEVPEDAYFVMGDNRNYSSDSRSWAEIAISDPDLNITSTEEAMAYSFVPADNIRGKAVFIYYSKHKHDRILKNPFQQ